MLLPAVLCLLLPLTAGIASRPLNSTSTTGIHAFLTHKLQMFTMPMKGGSIGSTSAPAVNQMKDREALKRLKNILTSLLESLPESKRPYPEPMNNSPMSYMGPAPADIPKTSNDLSFSREIDEDVSELLNNIKSNEDAQTRGTTSDTSISPTHKKVSSEVANNPPSYVFTTSDKFQHVINDTEKSLQKSIQMEENAERLLDEDVLKMRKAQMHLKGQDTSSLNDSLGNLESMTKETSFAFPKLTPYQESVKETEKHLDKRIQMEEKAEQMMDKEIASMKEIQKHAGTLDKTPHGLAKWNGSSDRVPPSPQYGSRSVAPRGIRPRSTNGVHPRPPQGIHSGQSETRRIASLDGEQLGSQDDVQQLTQLMQYLDKYIPDLNSYLKMDTEVGAAERAFSLLALMKNFLCVGREMQNQNSQKYFKPLIEDEMHILKMLLEIND
ncbi:uncharacterized protein LOC144825222 isoform X2 [Lissotriton helveticus]